MAVISLKRKTDITLESAFQKWVNFAQARNLSTLKKPVLSLQGVLGLYLAEKCCLSDECLWNKNTDNSCNCSHAGI
ncbi:MAG: hypothetical protein GX387_13820 [Clostridium sp.]|nr:hypothetical protein [Clostridium sp.]